MPMMPASLRWAVGLLGAQAAGLAVVVLVLVYEDVRAPAGTPHGAVAVTLYGLLIAVLVGGLCWALARRRRWARGPALVFELLLLPIGATMISGGLAWLGLVVLALGLGGTAALLAPTTRTALS